MSFFPSSVPTALQLLDARNNINVTLTAAINDSVTTIPVADTSLIPTAGYITAEDGSNEVIQYTGTTPSSLTGCTRGADGTTASSHGSGGTLGMWGNAAYHNILAGELVAISQFISDKIGLSTTQIVAPVASAAAPSYTFLGDLDTGIYHGAANTVSVAVNGVNTANFTTASLSSTLPFLAPDGSAGAPSYAFTNANSTGIYKHASNGMVFAVGGVDQWRIATNAFIPLATSAVMFINDGSAAAPSLAFNADPDTGIYRPGTNLFAIVTNGLIQWVVNATGALIGQQTGGVVRVEPASAAAPAYSFSADTDTGMYNAAANSLGFAVGASTRMTLGPSALTVAFNIIPDATASLRDIGDTSQYWQRIFMANGSAAAPAYSFGADSDTGFFGLGDNSIRFTLGGTQRHIFDSGSHTVLSDSGAVILQRVANGRTGYMALIGTLGAIDLRGGVNGAGESGSVSHRFTSDSPSAGTTHVQIVGGTGQLQMSDGSVAAPSLSFINDSNTGLYRAGADILGIVLGGIDVFEFQPTKFVPSIDNTYDLGSTALGFAHIFANNGSAAAPAYTFRNDSNTGAYLVGADSIGFATNGILRVTIDNSGLTVNSGTLSATFTFADGSAAAPSITFGADLDTGIFRNGANNIGFSAGGVIQLEMSTTKLISSVLFLAPDGSVSAPSYSFGADQDTGIYRPTTNQIDVAVGGLIGLSVNSNQQTLHRTGTLSLPSISFAGDPDTGFYSAGSGVIDVTGNAASLFDFNPTVNRSKVLFQITSTGIWNVNGTAAAPAYNFSSIQNSGLYYLGSVTGEVALSANGNLAYRTHPNVHAWYIGGVEKINIDSSGRFVPISDNTLSFGTSGLRWSTIFAANGTINTSHSSTKENIVDIDPEKYEVPAGVFYDRDGRRNMGYLNDCLPNEARPYENGQIVQTMNYENAVIGVLCAHVRKLEKELAELKTKAQFN